MRCSDVSKFEHIYDQIFMTPSCVYDRLFTWTIMVDFSALTVCKVLIDICFSVKSSLWALTAAYTKFRGMIWSMIWRCGHRSRSPMCTVLLPHRNAGRTLWFPGGSSHYRSWSAYLDSNFDGIDAVLMRKSWHCFVQITWRVISNMGWPHITPVCMGSHSQEYSGDGN